MVIHFGCNINHTGTVYHSFILCFMCVQVMIDKVIILYFIFLHSIKGGAGGPAYERSFRWKVGQFRHLCQVCFWFSLVAIRCKSYKTFIMSCTSHMYINDSDDPESNSS